MLNFDKSYFMSISTFISFNYLYYIYVESLHLILDYANYFISLTPIDQILTFILIAPHKHNIISLLERYIKTMTESRRDDTSLTPGFEPGESHPT